MSEQSNNHEAILKRLDDMEIAQGKRFKAIEEKLDPMYEMFSSVSGFNRISVWLLKLLAALGAGILGFYAIVELFKRISK